MNPSLLGAIAALLLAALWYTGRFRRPLLRSRDATAVAALNREQIAIRLAGMRPRQPGEGPAAPAAAANPPGGAITEPGKGGSADLPLPVTERQRHTFLAQLAAWCKGGQADRLRAMQVLGRWQHRDALPLLRRGLRDPDPAVMLQAAQAMEAYRGKPSPGQPPAAVPAQRTALPRNVSRTR